MKKARAGQISYRWNPKDTVCALSCSTFFCSSDLLGCGRDITLARTAATHSVPSYPACYFTRYPSLTAQRLLFLNWLRAQFARYPLQVLFVLYTREGELDSIRLTSIGRVWSPSLSVSHGRHKREGENMENAATLPSGWENGASAKPTLMAVDPTPMKGSREDGGGVTVTVLPTPSSKEWDAKAVQNLSPSDAMQENKAPSSKTPTSGGLPLKKPLPFRERNMEEGKRLLPPHITVPPKKLFGYPERYRSPTDAMVSPVSRGLLTRNRRPARTLAPMVPPKALENTFQDVVVDAVGGEGRLH